jgi:predicted nucleotidyltransferase
MNIYGLEMSKRFQEGYDSVAEQNGHVRLRVLSEWERTMSNILARIPSYPADDLQNLFSRKKELYYGEQYVGVTPVLLPNEVPIKYGSESYETLKTTPVTIEMDIQKDDYGIFMPAIYDGTSSPLVQIDGARVTRIMIYDGSFRGLFREGDRVEVVGSLQKVTPARLGQNSGGSLEFYQIMVGTKQGIGREYIKLIES